MAIPHTRPDCCTAADCSLSKTGGTRSAILTEEAVGLGKYGKTLTVLSSETIGREDDEDSDDETDDNVTERWTPRFRR